MIFLSIPEPTTQIIGAPDLYIESGSTINLTCVIENSPEPPAYIFWNHNNAVSGFTQFIRNKFGMQTKIGLVFSEIDSEEED